MDLGLSGRIAMVAAGTKGIGRAVAEELAAEGCLVSVCARNPPEAPFEHGGVRWIRADVSGARDLAAWHDSVKAALGTPSLLVTNTGGPPAGPWTETTDAMWARGVESTLLNVVRLVRLVSPAMREAGWGRIVHVTSLVAKEPNPLLPVSSTLRAGLAALTRLQATELAPHGVTVNAVLPGHTLTDRQRDLARLRASREGTTPEDALAAQARDVPAGRLASPREIAAAVAFLCSARASYITGVNLLVDGGSVRAPG